MKTIARIDHVSPPLWWRRLGSIVILSVVLLLLLLLLFSSLKHTTITITTTTMIAGTIAMKKTTIVPQLQQSSSTAVAASSLSLSLSYLEQLIPLNTNSSYVLSDIVRILHKPKEQFQIEIHLKDDSNVRQCKNPIFIGRISGWSLSMIEFDYGYQQEEYRNDNADNINNNNKNKSKNIIVGKYDQSKIPKSGTYYIEILILLCEEPNYWNDDLYKVCLKDSNIPKTRVTASPATITINIDENEDEVSTTAVTTSSTGDKPHFGRWLHKSCIEEGRKNWKKSRHLDHDRRCCGHDHRRCGTIGEARKVGLGDGSSVGSVVGSGVAGVGSGVSGTTCADVVSGTTAAWPGAGFVWQVWVPMFLV